MEKHIGRGGLISAIDSDGNRMIEQDITPYIEAAKAGRNAENAKINSSTSNLRKFATIPDFVAIEIMEKYKLNVHSPTFSQDPNNMKRLKTILMMEYSYLIENT